MTRGTPGDGNDIALSSLDVLLPRVITEKGRGGLREPATASQGEGSLEKRLVEKAHVRLIPDFERHTRLNSWLAWSW